MNVVISWSSICQPRDLVLNVMPESVLELRHYHNSFHVSHEIDEVFKQADVLVHGLLALGVICGLQGHHGTMTLVLWEEFINKHQFKVSEAREPQSACVHFVVQYVVVRGRPLDA
jgi:hypothetical protein